MIYFLQPVDGGPIKIGCSTNVEARRRQLETHYGRPMALLAMLPGGRDEEAKIHTRFAHLRFRNARGRAPEQFRPSPELMAYIGLQSLDELDIDSIEVMGHTGSKLKPVRLDLPPETHRLLRLVAADEEVSMAALARDLLEKQLREEMKSRGIKH